jgi:hypothetical protein
MAATPGEGAAGAAECIELVDEDDGRRLGARLLEEVAYAGSAHADEHLHELRTADREERHAGLAGHGLRQQRLARAGRPDQQHALGHAAAETAVFLRVLQEVDDFLELGLGLVDAGDVGERHLGVGLHIDLGLALADGHETAAETLLLRDLAEHEHPQSEEHHDRQNPGQDIAQQDAEAAFGGAPVGDAILLQFAGNVRIDARGHELGGFAGFGALDGAVDVLIGDDDVIDLAVLEVGLELAVGDRLDLLVLLPKRLQQQDPQHGRQRIPEVVLDLLIHASSLAMSGAAGDPATPVI